jgi:hypothetical protein
LKAFPAGGIGLQVQPFEADDGDEQIVDVDAVAAEHAFGAHRTQRCEQFEAVIDQRLTHAGLS